MDIALVGWLALTGGWLAAAVIAESLPSAGSPAALRRRVGWLTAFVLAGLGGIAGLIGGGAASAQVLLVAVPAAAVAVVTLPRLRRLYGGSAAFVTAPAAPSPPGLLARAAHPLVALPVQVTAVALVPVAARYFGGVPGVGVVADGLGVVADGLVLTVAVILLVAVGVRHALRHSALAEHAVVGRLPRS